MEINRKIKKVTSFAIIFAISCGIIAMPNNTSATSISELEEKIAAANERNEEIDSEIAKLEGNISANEQMQTLYFEKLTASKDMVDYYNNLIYYKEAEIEEKQVEIQQLDDKIAAKEDDIAQRQTDIQNLQLENENNLDKFGEIVRAIYVTNNVDFASVLANSADIYDLLVRTKLMANISQQNLEFMDELKASIADIEKMIADLETDVVELNADKAISTAEKISLDNDKAELLEQQQAEALISEQYNADYAYYSGLIADFEYMQSRLEDERAANAEEVAAYEQEMQRLIREAQEGSNQVYVDGDWMWPLNRGFGYITTYFGYDSWRGGNHSGIDIGDGGINRTNIYASKSGTVIKAKYTYIEGYSYGKYVVIDHGDGYSTLYGHCSELYVTEGQVVNQGDVIGLVGSTGWSTGPHLHFEVRIDGIAQNPFNYVQIP